MLHCAAYIDRAILTVVRVPLFGVDIYIMTSAKFSTKATLYKFVLTKTMAKLVTRKQKRELQTLLHIAASLSLVYKRNDVETR